jgi:Fe-S oxidoreductase
MERFKDQTWCCGAGGGLLEAYPDEAAWAAQQRINEAKATTGADTLVTACPWCEFSFKNAVEAMGAKIKVNSIADVLQRASK